AGAVAGGEVAELLVRQGLERRSVERLPPLGQRPFEGELRDHGLARAGGGGDKDGLAPVEGLDGRPLELVKRERVGPGEPGRIGHVPPSVGTRRALPGGSAAPRTYRSSGGT